MPLQSARDGFTKLYIHVSSRLGEDIEELFLGVSQAAATFGTSADKVDRVNYAFAQMASKGQIMSEELKVSSATCFLGPWAFLRKLLAWKALCNPAVFQSIEDGAYKGENMNKLLKNVAMFFKRSLDWRRRSCTHIPRLD